MANKYNPQIKIEMFKLSTDGEELPMDIELIPEDIQLHEGNKPILVECNINKSLGSVQQSASITLHNAPIIEEIRTNYESYLNKIRDQNWRVKIWAWFSDSRARTQPANSPIFIGDIYDEFNIQSSSVNDSAITLSAAGHDFLMRSGKYKTEYPAEISYLDVVNDIFAYMITLGYGPKIVIGDVEDALGQTIYERPTVINRNPTETLNDICRHLDFSWGVDCKTLYILKRNELFIEDQLPEIYDDNIALSVATTGATSLVNLSKYTFSFSTLFDNEFSLGKALGTVEYPQINYLDSIVKGRINSLNINLNNYTGHHCDIECQYFGEGNNVVLPPQREDSSGRRT